MIQIPGSRPSSARVAYVNSFNPPDQPEGDVFTLLPSGEGKDAGSGGHVRSAHGSAGGSALAGEGLSPAKAKALVPQLGLSQGPSLLPPPPGGCALQVLWGTIGIVVNGLRQIYHHQHGVSPRTRGAVCEGA